MLPFVWAVPTPTPTPTPTSTSTHLSPCMCVLGEILYYMIKLLDSIPIRPVGPLLSPRPAPSLMSISVTRCG